MATRILGVTNSVDAALFVLVEETDEHQALGAYNTVAALSDNDPLQGLRAHHIAAAAVVAAVAVGSPWFCGGVHDVTFRAPSLVTIDTGDL